MSQNAIDFAIEHALQFLAHQSWDLFDAWYEFLHDVPAGSGNECGEEIRERFNATNLDLMLAAAQPPAQV
jgi:hypothetical protein